VQWFVERKVPRSMSVILVVLAFILIVVGAGLLVAPIVISQIQTFIGDLPDIVANLAATGWVLELEQQLTGAIDVDAIFANLGDWVSDPKYVLSGCVGVVMYVDW